MTIGLLNFSTTNLAEPVKREIKDKIWLVCESCQIWRSENTVEWRRSMEEMKSVVEKDLNNSLNHVFRFNFQVYYIDQLDLFNRWRSNVVKISTIKSNIDFLTRFIISIKYLVPVP